MVHYTLHVGATCKLLVNLFFRCFKSHTIIKYDAASRVCFVDVSWRKGAQEYVVAVGPIIERVEELFAERKLPVDW